MKTSSLRSAAAKRAARLEKQRGTEENSGVQEPVAHQIPTSPQQISNKRMSTRKLYYLVVNVCKVLVFCGFYYYSLIVDQDPDKPRDAN